MPPSWRSERPPSEVLEFEDAVEEMIQKGALEAVQSEAELSLAEYLQRQETAAQSKWGCSLAVYAEAAEAAAQCKWELSQGESALHECD